MVVACFVGQQPEGGSEHGGNECRSCGEVTFLSRRYCALCALKGEMGLVKLGEGYIDMGGSGF